MSRFIEWVVTSPFLVLEWLIERAAYLWTFRRNAGPCQKCESYRTQVFDRVGDVDLIWCLSCKRASSREAASGAR